MLFIILWKFWTAVGLVGVALGWWGWTWPLLAFFLPELVFFIHLAGHAYKGRRERMAEERAERKPGGD